MKTLRLFAFASIISLAGFPIANAADVNTARESYTVKSKNNPGWLLAAGGLLKEKKIRGQKKYKWLSPNSDLCRDYGCGHVAWGFDFNADGVLSINEIAKVYDNYGKIIYRDNDGGWGFGGDGK